LRRLETTATYDRQTQEFILDSPTLTSTKFWPGSAGKTANFAIVMAKLVIGQHDHGIHAFIVQLRCLRTHKSLPGVECGDLGRKYGYDVIDNGYVRFHKLRIPRQNMLMRFAQVSEEGEFKRLGNELMMYACMLIMRSTLCMFSSLLLSISTTIAVRYSCVRRQTPSSDSHGYYLTLYSFIIEIKANPKLRVIMIISTFVELVECRFWGFSDQLIARIRFLFHVNT
jgi:acyl-CoA oxidase